jgi:glycosyltransferase involved in cell wall biosynthesis
MALLEPSQGPSMTVLFSQPLTVRPPFRLPASFCHWASEGKLSYLFGQRYPRAISEHLVRCHVAWSLLTRRKDHGGVITGRYGEWFAALQGLWPFGRKPHLLLDVEWPHRQTSAWRRWASSRFRRLLARGVSRIQVFCEIEAEHYADYFGIDRAKFVWIPYCLDLDADAPAATDGDYLFTGGLQQRDYATLHQAIRDLPVKVVVAAPPDRIDPRHVSANMELTGQVSRARFLERMAGARLVVLSLQDGLLRHPGVVTYVTALRLGKCIVVNDPDGAGSYIRHGETGWLVPPRDPAALGEAIRFLWDDQPRRQALAANASADSARRFGLDRYRADLERLTRDWPATPSEMLP